MRRASRASRGRARGRLAGALVATVAAAPVAIALAGSAVGAAAPKTITVSFTDNGPSPGSVRVGVGDSVTYVNKLTQGGSVPVTPGQVAQVQSAAVTVHGAATSDFTLPELGSSRTLSYTAPGTVGYTATYTMRLVPVLSPLGVNLVPDTITKSTAGQVTVTAASGKSTRQDPDGQPPAHGGPHGGPAQGGGLAGQRDGGGPTDQVPGPGVAGGVAPPGTGGSAANARPPLPAGTGLDGQSDQSELQPSGVGAGGYGQGELVGRAGRSTAFGRSAMIAVILLSVVTAALVRTLVVGGAVPPHRTRRRTG